MDFLAKIVYESTPMKVLQGQDVAEELDLTGPLQKKQMQNGKLFYVFEHPQQLHPKTAQIFETYQD